MSQFQDITAGGASPFLKIAQSDVQALEAITPSDLGQAVPVMKIWRVDPTTGAPLFPDSTGKNPAIPISTQAIYPPRFGQQATQGNDVTFRERPPFSFEKLEVTNINPRGVTLYRQVKMTWIVHRPDVVFGDKVPGQDNWSDLLISGYLFNIRYGWSASPSVKNPILNGTGTANVPSQQDIRIAITNFRFSFTQSFELQFEIEGLESGELMIRQQTVDATVTHKSSKQSAIPLYLPTDASTTAGKAQLKKIQKLFKQQLLKHAKGTGSNATITMKQLLNTFFAPGLSNAFQSQGFNTVNLWLGNFNHRAGFTTKYYGAAQQSDKPIGNFPIPLEIVEKEFGKLVKLGKSITIYNFIKPFLDLTHGEKVWDTSNAPKDSKQRNSTKLPQVMMKTLINPKAKTAEVYIVDLVREHTKLIQDESTSASANVVQGGTPTKASIRSALQSSGVPYVTLLKANSYIQAANFQVVLDDKMKSILVRRGLGPQTSKTQKTKQTDVAAKSNLAIDPRQMLYSSAIQGELTMLGNFAFDTFGLLWLDFNIPRWNGPFFVMHIVDVIEKGNFTRSITLQSEGDDPLGTQQADAKAHPY
ncbi:MAG: hypothetical protein ACYDHY_07810 [Acidiferrobacterales bacterium]